MVGVLEWMKPSTMILSSISMMNATVKNQPTFDTKTLMVLVSLARGSSMASMTDEKMMRKMMNGSNHGCHTT